MSAIFVSYARADRNVVELLAADLRSIGCLPWFDAELIGGTPWWEGILQKIRDADAFVLVVSNHAATSVACLSELAYATALGTLIVPVAIHPLDDIPGLPQTIKNLQAINYSNGTKADLGALARAFHQLPRRKPLPNPLPVPPAQPEGKKVSKDAPRYSPSLSIEKGLSVAGPTNYLPSAAVIAPSNANWLSDVTIFVQDKIPDKLKAWFAVTLLPVLTYGLIVEMQWQRPFWMTDFVLGIWSTLAQAFHWRMSLVSSMLIIGTAIGAIYWTYQNHENQICVFTSDYWITSLACIPIACLALSVAPLATGQTAFSSHSIVGLALGAHVLTQWLCTAAE